MQSKVGVFWFRRDLRSFDNHGFYKALTGEYPVLPIFIFDTEILDKLEDKSDARVTFIYNAIADLKKTFQEKGSDIKVFVGSPNQVWKELLERYEVKEVYTNEDYEPYAKERDEKVEDLLADNGIKFHRFKDHVIFNGAEIFKADGTPYTIYTPYSRRWKERLSTSSVSSFASEEHLDKLLPVEAETMLSISEVGFSASSLEFPKVDVPESILTEYENQRDFPAIRGTSRLSVHLRFGTVSIRRRVAEAQEKSEKFLNELIWRDFYSMILFNFPHVVNGAFKPQYDRVEWRQDEVSFKKWCEGATGIPIVDAGMRELNETGFMHNRVRMIVASFLVKNLLIDWRWGEQYFAEKLLDFDLASNNGGWQWAAGSGCDAAPYFRIFNPITQAQKFDPQFKYIKKWVPEVNSFDYPQPIVDLKMSRKRALEAYEVVRK